MKTMLMKGKRGMGVEAPRMAVTTQCIVGIDSTSRVNSGHPITATNAVATASVATGPERQWFYRVGALP